METKNLLEFLIFQLRIFSKQVKFFFPLKEKKECEKYKEVEYFFNLLCLGQVAGMSNGLNILLPYPYTVNLEITNR